MIYLLVATWLVVAYAFGWFRGRQGWPFLWRKAVTIPPSVPRETEKPIVLPVDEPDKMRERLTDTVPGFAQMPPDQQDRVLARMKQKAESFLGMRS